MKKYIPKNNLFSYINVNIRDYFETLFSINPESFLFGILHPGWRMNPNKKPKTPVRIYKWFILWGTINDWLYVAPSSKESQVFKVGWRGSHTSNYNHPLRRLELRKLKEEQEKVLARKEMDWKELEKITINI